MLPINTLSTALIVVMSVLSSSPYHNFMPNRLPYFLELAQTREKVVVTSMVGLDTRDDIGRRIITHHVDAQNVMHGRHQESEAGGNVGQGPGHRGAMEIGVWGLWAKCRPGLELAGGLNPPTSVHVYIRSFLTNNRLQILIHGQNFKRFDM